MVAGRVEYKHYRCPPTGAKEKNLTQQKCSCIEGQTENVNKSKGLKKMGTKMETYT